MKRSSKKYYLIIAILLFIIEVLIALYVNDSFIRPFLGDVIVVILIYSFIMALSNLSIIRAAVITLLFSYMVEIAQYFQIVSILGLEDYRWARIIIGTSFSWWDMVCYTVGFGIILLIERCKDELS